MDHTFLSLDRVETWPSELIELIGKHRELFLDWEQDGEYKHDSGAWDGAMHDLRVQLKHYAIEGIHCTRLTSHEISDILVNGLHVLDATTLQRRINALVAAGMLTPNVAALLTSRHQAGDKNRAGKLWFCFFRPELAGESGIGRFFRHWGGESLYNSHEENLVTSAALATAGMPSLVLAEVPVALLGNTFGLARSIVRRFLINQGHQITEPIECEGHIVSKLPAANIRRIIRFPEPEFLALTGCLNWEKPLD